MNNNKLTGKIIELEYPYNLIYIVFDDDEVEADEIYNNAISMLDFKATIEYVLSMLTDHEKMIIKYRFEELKTFGEIAKILNISNERARQLYKKALRKLRHPDRAKYIRYGVNGFIENLKSNYEHILDNINKVLVSANIELNTIKKESEPLNEMPTIYIEDIDLSVRTHNCLKRAGINTLQQLAQLNYYNLMHIRNLGKRSVDEIIKKLHSYGYEIKESDDDII